MTVLPYGPAQTLGPLPLAEVSGLAPAGSGDGLWALEDSGNDPSLQRLDRRGRIVATYRVGARNVDWEDLAAAGGQLYVADIGDNRARRDAVQVLRVAEPGAGDRGLGPVTTYRLRYEDGPHDAEALLVLPGGREVAVVTKALAGAAVYVAPLRTGAVQVLRRVAAPGLRPTSTPGGPLGSLGSVLVTGGAVSADGTSIVLRTYTDLYEWPLGSDLAEAFDAPGTRTPLPPTDQGEAVTYERDGSGVLVAGEGVGSPLQRLPRTAPAQAPALPGGSGWPLPALALAGGLLLAVVLVARRASG